MENLLLMTAILNWLVSDLISSDIPGFTLFFILIGVLAIGLLSFRPKLSQRN